jgi:hypothetical protein
MTIQEAVNILDAFIGNRHTTFRFEAWQTLKSSVLAQQTNNSVRDAIVEEARLLCENHPSKDCRAFASSVLRFLQQHP